MKDRKIQVRLVPSTFGRKALQYRIDPKELSFFGRLFNRWTTLHSFSRPAFFYDDPETGWAPVTKYNIGSAKLVFKTEKDIRNHNIGAMGLYRSFMRARDIFMKEYQRIEY